MRSVLAALGATVLVAGVATPQARAANIIQFDDNATSCGGSVLCSTNGTTGYTGTLPFDLTTIGSWFQIDTTTSLLPGQPAQSMNAGHFLVINNTGSTVTSFSITLTDTFDSHTASVGACPGTSGTLCDNFQANKGAAAPSGASESLSGPDFFNCTNGAAGGGAPCFSNAGQAAANFEPNLVTYTWSGLDIAAGSTFDITFSSWNNSVSVPGPTVGAGLPGLIFAGAGLFGWLLRRRPTALAAA